MKVYLDENEWKLYPHCPKEIHSGYLNDEISKILFNETIEELDKDGGLHPREIISIIDKIENRNEMYNLDINKCIDRLIIELSLD